MVHPVHSNFSQGQVPTRFTTHCVVIIALSVVFLSPFLLGAVLPPLRGLSRTDLLEFHGAKGVENARTPKNWEMRRKEVIEGFLGVIGSLPSGARCTLDLKIESETDCGSYVRRLISYQSTEGGRVPAYLCVPKAALGGRPAPGVLCLHPTDNAVGHGVVVGLGGKVNRQYAAELAERGFVTLSPSYPHLAEYKPDLKKLGFASGTAKAVWDNIRGLDLLETFPFVRKEVGFATIGHSLGGHNSIFTAVLDARLKVVVSSCGFDSFLDYYGGDIKGWVQERYMPGLASFLGKPQDVPFDFYELIAALAPRFVFVNAPLADANFKADSVDRIAAAARPIFGLYQAEERLRVVHPDSTHDFPNTERFESYRLIEQVLGRP